MKYSIPLKFFVILITALALVLSFFSALGIVQAVSYDLYTRSMADWAREQVSNRADSYCMQVLESYVTKQLTTCSPEELSALDNKFYYGLDSLESLSEGDYRCTVYDETGAERLTLGSAEKGTDFTCSTTVWYPVIVHRGYTDREMASVNTEQEGMYWVRCADGTWSAARYVSSPLYTAKLLLQPEAVLERYGTSLRMVELLHAASPEMDPEILAGIKQKKDGTLSGKAALEYESLMEIDNVMRKTISDTARGMYSGRAPRTPSESACKFCKMKSTCPIAHKS